ncbi:MAG: DUF1844 domain-containing protein [Phycisphaerae bacterium]
MDINEPDKVNSELRVDADWKTQAQTEKAKLAEKVGDSAAPPMTDKTTMPESSASSMTASFDLIVEQYAAQALLAMGAIPQSGGEKKINIGLARLFIDSLAVLEDKTRGNLTVSEQRSLLTALTDLRLTYVNVLKTMKK